MFRKKYVYTNFVKQERKKTIAVVKLLGFDTATTLLVSHCCEESSTMAAAVAHSPLTPFSRHVLHMSQLLMVTQL